MSPSQKHKKIGGCSEAQSLLPNAFLIHFFVLLIAGVGVGIAVAYLFCRFLFN